MFSFFKKSPPKTSLADILSFSDSDFLISVEKTVNQGPPNAWLMIAVAMANLNAITSALVVNKTISNIDDFIRIVATSIEKHSDDDFAYRRLAWFYQAALIKRATERGLNRSGHEEILSNIWICLAEGCALLPTGLSNNQLWDSDEKAWFSLIKNSNAGMSYCLNHIMPKELRKYQKIKSFSDKHEIFLSIF